tara:strand:- start:282 stop:527 length:246 start_codon:yes stop_codon:yes gene_type:complete
MGNTKTTIWKGSRAVVYCRICVRSFKAGEQVDIRWEQRAAYATRYGQNRAPNANYAVGSHTACIAKVRSGEISLDQIGFGS